MKHAPFPINPELTQIAIAYRNQALIADSVLPRVGVGKQEFKYYRYAKEERFTLPETHVGRKSQPNEVEFGMAEEPAATRDYALEDPIPYADIENAPEGYDPREHAVEAIQDLLALAREKRVADMVFDPNNYDSANKKALDTGWNVEGSKPLDDLLYALDAPIVRPNVVTFGQAAWRALSVHPQIVKAVHGNSGDSGVASRQAVAQLLEVDEVLVGRGFLNTAKKGQAASFQRVWGESVLAFYRNPTANVRGGVTFGLTFQWGDRIAGEFEDRNIGMRGGVRVRSGESVIEKLIAPDVAYLLTGIIAN